jgi:hypothetical protein
MRIRTPLMELLSGLEEDRFQQGEAGDHPWPKELAVFGISRCQT